MTLGANLLRKCCTLQLFRNIQRPNRTPDYKEECSQADNGCIGKPPGWRHQSGRMRFSGLDPTHSMLPRIGPKVSGTRERDVIQWHLFRVIWLSPPHPPRLYRSIARETWHV